MKYTAGPENRPLVFVFSDNDVVNELFLEDINNLLNSGEVPNIYTNDEIKDVKEAMRKEAKRLKKPETSDVLWQIFVDNVKTNLHIAFCISPIGNKFRDYCRVYPSLINNTTISWYMPWPRDALYEVSKKFINEKLDFK
jgi:dynein heavy chain